MKKALAVILIICFLFIGKMAMTDEVQEPLTVVSNEEMPSSEETVIVHVDGAVSAPGLVVLPAGARTEEAIVKAGGLLAEADTKGLNLARIVVDQEKIYVPVKGQTDIAGGGQSLIPINLATEAELCELPGVGPARAQAIMRFRETTPIRGPEDLLEIPGIGQKTVESWEGLIQY